ncbi:MAG: endo-1,4-beta-xylanase [Rikenellaceae bacterium]|jgi:GH35 family endo-1,4-beta-xylanase|nr:endo-1,4-beta-xylanase [Rikenellaceae bacterium]
MKFGCKLLLGAAALLMICCTEKDIPKEDPGNNNGGVVEEPDKEPDNEPDNEPDTLDTYGALKEYVNRQTTPNFKLGSGVDVPSFLVDGNAVYTVTVANFDEVTAGNAMKYSSVVSGGGVMNTDNVTRFVQRAQSAGVTIYGHTLVWHSQQQPTYLKSLIMKEVAEQDFETDDKSNYNNNSWSDFVVLGFTADGEGAGGTGRALTLTNSAVRANDYDAQFFFYIPKATAGKEYTFSMDIRSDAPASVATQFHSDPGTYLTSEALGTIETTAEWQHFEWAGTTDQTDLRTIAFNLGATVTKYYIDNIEWTDGSETEDEENKEVATELITNGGFETDDDTNYVAFNSADMSYVAEGKTGRAVKLSNSAVRENPWDAQFVVSWSPAMKAGERYEFSVDIRADQATTIGTQAQTAPGVYLSNQKDLSITTEWKTFKTGAVFSGGNVVAGMGALAFDLGKTATNFYFDNLSLKKIEGGGNDMFPEEVVKANLTAELERWIGGMMTATEGYVTAWDVVNEPMSDWPDPSQLKTTPASPANGEFYWQDYLGKDYARIAIRIAREKSSVPLTLFINDYGLESVGNDKVKGLIAMVDYWEQDGTVIDGIGTQMHVTYSLNPTEQKAQEDAIVSMYELLAATGKLIKISELDMGIKDASGNTIRTASVTAEQHRKMAEFYRFIVGKYVEIIPAEQQYGITQWAATDSPSNSGWRPNEPIGIYDLNYKRKPAYAGFALGLGGTPPAL